MYFTLPIKGLTVGSGMRHYEDSSPFSTHVMPDQINSDIKVCYSSIYGIRLKFPFFLSTKAIKIAIS